MLIKLRSLSEALKITKPDDKLLVIKILSTKSVSAEAGFSNEMHKATQSQKAITQPIQQK